MDKPSLAGLVKWAEGKSLGVSLSAINALATTGVVRDFLEARRTRAGRFAIDPAGDGTAWFAYYRSQKLFERSAAKAMLGEYADQAIQLMDALRKPKRADKETKELCLGLILACFMKPSGPELSQILAPLVCGDEGEEPQDQIPDDASSLFSFWVFLPCWFVYGRTPMQLMRRVSQLDQQADKAVERIVRLDYRAAKHPIIQRWLWANAELAPFKQAKLDKWRARSPFEKEKSESLALRQIAGLTATLSDLFDDPVDVNDQRDLIKALGDEIPEDLQVYVVGQTNDDLSRGIRRQKAHFKLPPKPDKFACESVRALLERCK